MSMDPNLPRGSIKPVKDEPRDEYDAERIKSYCVRRMAGASKEEAYLKGVRADVKHPRQSAQQFERRPAVMACMKRLQEGSLVEFMDRTRKCQDEILGLVGEVVERCMQKKPVLGKDGEPTGEWTFDPNNALKGLSLYGTQIGMFQKTSNVNVREGDPLKGKSPAEIIDLFGEAADAITASKQRQIGKEDAIDVEPDESRSSGPDHGPQEDERVVPVQPVREAG